MLMTVLKGEKATEQSKALIRIFKRMKTFYSEYHDDLEFVQLVAQLPWTHNIILIEKIKNKKIRK